MPARVTLEPHPGNDAEANDAATMAAFAAGARVIEIEGAVWPYTIPIMLGPGQSLRGVDLIASVLRSETADACVRISERNATGHYAGPCGNLTIDGNGLANNPLLVAKCNQQTFDPMIVRGATGDGVVLEGTQNAQFRNLRVEDCGGSGVRLDYGAAGNQFYGGNIANCGLWLLASTAEGGYQHSPPLPVENVPSAMNTLYGTVLEYRERTNALGCVYLSGGKHLSMERCTLAMASALHPTTIIKVHVEESSLLPEPQHLHIVRCALSGNKTHVTMLDQDAGTSVYVEGVSTLNNVLRGWYHAAGAVLEMVHGTIRGQASAVTWNVVRP